MTKNKTDLIIIDECNLDKDGEPKVLRGTAAQLVLMKDFGYKKLVEYKNNDENNSYYIKKPLLTLNNKIEGFLYDDVK